jgi:hypothetical protein
MGSGGLGPGATPLAPLLRDELGLNEADGLGGLELAAGGKRAAAARQAAMRSELRERLAGLPAPQNEYAFEVPEVPQVRGHGLASGGCWAVRGEHTAGLGCVTGGGGCPTWRGGASVYV